MTLGPMLAWRRVSAGGLWRTVRAPLAFAVLVLALLALATNAADSLPALAMFGLVALLLGVVVQEFARGALARRELTGEPLHTALRPAGGPQPAPLRRLHRARRHRRPVPGRGRLLGLPPAEGRAAVARPELQPGRLPRDLRQADRAPGRRRRGHGRADLLRGRDARAQGRRGQDAAPVAQLLPDPGPHQGRHRALLRGRGHQRGRRALGPAARLLAGHAARHQLARQAHPRRRPQVPPADGGHPGAADRRAGRELPPQPAARHLPGHRLAAGLVDLDRRRHRPPGRPGGRLAVARGQAAARAQPVLGAAGQGAGGPRAS